MITIISGTNRPHSNTFKLASYYQQKLTDRSVDAHILSLADLSADFITADMYKSRSPAFQPYQDRITATEKFIFIIPEYNGSFPGILKTFVDACQFPNSFFNKKRRWWDCPVASTVMCAGSTILRVCVIMCVCRCCHYASISRTSSRN